MAAKKSTSKSSTKKATATKTTEKQAAKKIERDKWGAGTTTQVARINAAITATPIKAKDIAEKANANQAATQSHLRTLIGKGLIEKTAEGYKLVKATRKRSK